MKNVFASEITRLQKEVEALKAARTKSIQTLTFKTWTGTAPIAVSNYSATNSIKITITPLDSSDNLLTAVYCAGDSWILQPWRTVSGSSIIYYLVYRMKQGDYPESASETIALYVRYSAPAAISVESVSPIS